MKIQFKKDTWVVQSNGGGFCGNYLKRATLVTGLVPFEIKEVQLKGKRYSDIWVWSDNCCDGQNQWIINVPNELFEEVI